MKAPFHWTGLDPLATPVVVSVPHAGRRYPAALAELARLDEAQLRVLEDRYAERLARAAAIAGHAVLVADVARAWIDLNRDEDELDPAMIARVPPHGLRLRTTTKVRGGLGLIPQRIAQGGDIWKSPLSPNDVEARLEAVHRPYHAALGQALAARRRVFGAAVLIDLHSMPPLSSSRSDPAPHLVIGNRYGATASDRFTDRALHEVSSAGLRVALNTPYAGGYVLERHGNPRGGVHALQIEIDRSLYLDAGFDQPGKGAATIAQLVLRLADALAEEAVGPALAIAAE